MIRVTCIVCLAALLVMVLYVPFAYPTERFLDQLRQEHGSIAQLWNDAVAARILDTALGLQDSARRAAPSPHAAPPAASSAAVGTAVAGEMASVSQRLFGNPYFRSIEALFLLAMFRLGTMAHALPWCLPFVVAVLADGQVSRLLKAREFRPHDPQVFALAIATAIAVSCVTFLALLVPAEVPAIVWTVAPVIVALLAGRALACFHLRA
jgi:hypothetical protein